MKLYTCIQGDRLADTVETITPDYAARLKAQGYRGVMRYVSGLSRIELDACFAAGLAVGFVTYANELVPGFHVTKLQSFGVPAGVHVFLDVEGASHHSRWQQSDPNAVDAQVIEERVWGSAVLNGGFTPARYSGADQRLTGLEQYQLPYRLYWHSCSNVMDRFGNPSTPTCDYAMYQDTKYNVPLGGGLIIDINRVVGDKAGRLPILVQGD